MTFYFLLCFVVTLINASVSLGFALFHLTHSKGENHTANMYTVSRSAALFIVCLVVFFIDDPVDSDIWLIATAVAMIIVQVFDTVIGIISRDKMTMCGPLSLALLNAIALFLFLQNNIIGGPL